MICNSHISMSALFTLPGHWGMATSWHVAPGSLFLSDQMVLHAPWALCADYWNQTRGRWERNWDTWEWRLAWISPWPIWMMFPLSAPTWFPSPWPLLSPHFIQWGHFMFCTALVGALFGPLSPWWAIKWPRLITRSHWDVLCHVRLLDFQFVKKMG